MYSYKGRNSYPPYVLSPSSHGDREPPSNPFVRPISLVLVWLSTNRSKQQPAETCPTSLLKRECHTQVSHSQPFKQMHPIRKMIECSGGSIEVTVL